jgi:hypothetical protein
MNIEELIKELPTEVVYTRTFTYHPAEAAQSWVDMNQTELTVEEVLQMIDEWAQEDMRSPASRHDMYRQEIYLPISDVE